MLVVKILIHVAMSMMDMADHLEAAHSLSVSCLPMHLRAAFVFVGPYFLLPVVNGSVVGCALEGSLSQEESDVREADGLVCPEPGCGRTFTKLSKLKVHTMQHTGERPFKVQAALGAYDTTVCVCVYNVCVCACL